MSAAKRVFFYAVSFVTLGMFAAGIGILLHLCFSLLFRNPQVVRVGVQSFSREQLSLGLAMLVIGGVVWFFFWRAIQKSASASIEETGAAIRKVYLNLILTTTAIMALVSVGGILYWLMQEAPRTGDSATPLAFLLVPGVLWYYHWRVEKREGQPSPAAKTLKRWYVYILSTWGLVWLCTSLVRLLSTLILHLPIWGQSLVRTSLWDGALQSALAGVLPAGLAWGFHWFYAAKGDTDSTLRQVYLYLFTIMGSAIAGLTVLTITLYRLIRFCFGNLTVTGGNYFQFLSWTLPVALGAAAVWTYHRAVVQEEAAPEQERRLSARRLSIYLMALLGLGTTVGGLIMLFGILLELLISNLRGAVAVGAPGLWRDYLSTALAMIVVGAPIWLYYWDRVLKMVSTGGVTERSAGSRRIYLYLVLGVATITLAADLINIIYQLLNGWLQGNFGVTTLDKSRWSLQTLLVALPLLWYHWRILRQDQRYGAEAVPVKKRVTVLAGGQARELIATIEKRLGSRVHTLRTHSVAEEQALALSEAEIDHLVREIQGAATPRVMLVITAEKILVLPYEGK